MSLTTKQAATTNVSASFMLAYYCDLDCDFSLSGSRFISDAAAAIGRRIYDRMMHSLGAFTFRANTEVKNNCRQINNASSANNRYRAG